MHVAAALNVVEAYSEFSVRQWTGEVEAISTRRHSAQRLRAAVVTAAFDDYLIVGYKTVYRVSHIVEWTFTARGKVPPRKPLYDSAAQVSALPPEVKAVLVKRFPKFAYIQ